jgi:hypothetical protein
VGLDQQRRAAIPGVTVTGTYSETVLSGVGPTLDWNSNEAYRIALTGSTTMAFSNVDASTNVGKTITVVAVNGGAYTLDFPGSVEWAGGTAPTMTSGASKKDIFRFTNSNGTVYGEVVAQDLS